MTDNLQHECGIAMIRFKKNLKYYADKYKIDNYEVLKMYLLMQKQHNRGQDGAGIANVNIDLPPGKPYIHKVKSIKNNPLVDIFSAIEKQKKVKNRFFEQKQNDYDWIKKNIPYSGEVWLGHLRYGTFGKNGVKDCHPFVRKSNWRSKNLVLAGNFTMTNSEELFQNLVKLGQHPKGKIDTVTVMEKIGHFLDEEIDRIFDSHKGKGKLGLELSHIIEKTMNMKNILYPSFKNFDGGFVITGIIGHGTSFVVRDAHGIRPAYFYENEEVVVVASEKPAIKTAFNIEYDNILPIPPGNALIVNKNGESEILEILTPKEKKSCSFERIYFSRGTDPDIYKERKMLGSLLFPQINKVIQDNFENSVFSYIPNTAETCFLGLTEAANNHISSRLRESVYENGFNKEKFKKFSSLKLRTEKLVVKDVKIRTFIEVDDDHKDEEKKNITKSHKYDTTYEVINKDEDSLVIIDDSIVRGNTIKNSIIPMLDRLKPQKIVFISAAPQIRYPDCYGIDMSRIGKLIAFQAAISLLKGSNRNNVIEEVYEKCKKSIEANNHKENHVKAIYKSLTPQKIADKIAIMVKKSEIQAEVVIIFQTIENLNKAIPHHKGDWYFTGDYPTLGGNRIVNISFYNYYLGINSRPC